jgi:hypothetical protein
MMGEKIERIKQHMKDHKEAYITGGVCVVVTAAVTYLIIKHDTVLETDESVALVNNIKGLFYKSPVTNDITQIVVRRGHPGFIVKCNETGTIFASISQAAKEMGISASNISQHLKGKYDHAGGFTFTNLGEAV